MKEMVNNQTTRTGISGKIFSDERHFRSRIDQDTRRANII